jgi:hypothetical protein
VCACGKKIKGNNGLAVIEAPRYACDERHQSPSLQLEPDGKLYHEEQTLTRGHVYCLPSVHIVLTGEQPAFEKNVPLNFQRDLSFYFSSVRMGGKSSTSRI